MKGLEQPWNWGSEKWKKPQAILVSMGALDEEKKKPK